jgi:hypothetical protein
MRDSALLLSLKKKYISASRQLRCVYVNPGNSESSFTSGWGSAAITRGVMSPAGSISVAKLRSGAPLASRNVLSTTSVGVLPTKITLPPALTKARKRSRPVRVITVEEGTTMAR